ncbi:MAG: hypothetical protein HRU13_04200 [Phycisphaerales bacterium]|nr:hypothetical protein [Phycisphaerales bacterium]
MRWIVTIWVIPVSTSAVAQDPDPRYTVYIEVDPPIVEIGDSASITVWAGFNSDRDYAIASVLNDLLMTDGTDGVTNLRPGVLGTAGCPEPVVTDAGVEGLCGWQYNSETSVIADDSDPILYFSAEFRPTDTMDRFIELSTRTSLYSCYLWRCCLDSESRLDVLVEGHATITIIPCRADFNEDGQADLFDFLAFANAFDAGDPMADFDFDGELTVFDFLAFQDRFDRGC